MFAYEMPDGQLSCASFSPTSFEPGSFTFESIEMSDYIARDTQNDPIVKCFVLRKEIFFMMALRKSGAVDIYTNNQRFHTTKELCSDIFHDGQNVYYQERGTAKIRYIICDKERVEQWVKTRDVLPSFEKDIVIHKRVSEYFKFPQSFCLYKNTLFVAYGKILH